jgi:hypothetical protein
MGSCKTRRGSCGQRVEPSAYRLIGACGSHRLDNRRHKPRACGALDDRENRRISLKACVRAGHRQLISVCEHRGDLLLRILLHLSSVGESSGPSGKLPRTCRIAYREIIAVRECNELSNEETSNLLEVPIGTVISRLSWARDRLKRMIQA